MLDFFFFFFGIEKLSGCRRSEEKEGSKPFFRSRYSNSRLEANTSPLPFFFFFPRKSLHETRSFEMKRGEKSLDTSRGVGARGSDAPCPPTQFSSLVPESPDKT